MRQEYGDHSIAGSSNQINQSINRSSINHPVIYFIRERIIFSSQFGMSVVYAATPTCLEVKHTVFRKSASRDNRSYVVVAKFLGNPVT